MSAEDARKLFVAGLPDTITEDILRQLFEATGGTVADVSIPRDRATGRPRGFGFVTLATSEEAALARDSLDGSVQAGRPISVRPFQAEPPRRGEGAPRPLVAPTVPFAPPSPDRTLYVGNLPYDISEQEVEEFITSKGGAVVSRVNLPMDPDGRRRGFGFVTMESAEAALKALDGLRNADLRGRRLVLNIAHPKGDRPARPDGAPPSGRSLGPPSGGPDRPMRGPGPGFPPAPPPDPPRRTFDDRRRTTAARPETESAERARRAGKTRGGAGGAGGGGRRNRNEWDVDDYLDDDE